MSKHRVLLPSLPGDFSSVIFGLTTTYIYTRWAECEKQQRFDIFSPSGGGCSECLDAFRFFFEQLGCSQRSHLNVLTCFPFDWVNAQKSYVRSIFLDLQCGHSEG